MIRHIDLAEISDGRRYRANDMVKADCGGCEGCFSCCEGMGTSVVLDPYDVHQLVKGLSVTFEQLLASVLELNVVDGLILPNVKMAGEKEQRQGQSARRVEMGRAAPGLELCGVKL